MKGRVRCSMVCAAWFLLVAALPSCRAAEHDASEEFLHQPMNERRSAILAYPPQKQVDLYLQAMLLKHPPDLALADSVASNGPKIVPALLQRLVEDNRDVAKMHIIDVFRRMQELGSYAVVSDAHTMDILEQQVAEITDPQWQEMSSELLERIRARE